MVLQPRQLSPKWTPSPLSPSPWNTPHVSPISAKLPDRRGDVERGKIAPGVYLSTVARPMQDPHDILHDLYNVRPVPFRFEVDGSVPRTVEMPLLRRTDIRPTHALAVLSSLYQPPSTLRSLTLPSHPNGLVHPPPSPSSPSSPSSPYSPIQTEPFLLPIDAAVFSTQFGHEVARSLTSKYPTRPGAPLIHRDRLTGAQVLTLPLIPLYVPHPPSIPHLLLFGQGLPAIPLRPREPPNYSRPAPAPSPRSPPSPSIFATYLLPISAIEEFPSAPAMAEVMVRQCSEEGLRDHVVFNQGLWRNVLLLAPTDSALVDIARVAWNVTANARRLRERQRVGLTESPLPRSPRVNELDFAVANVNVNVQYVDTGGLRVVRDAIHLAPIPPGQKPPGRRRSEKSLKG